MKQSISQSVLKTIGSAVTRSGNNARLSILIYHRVLPNPDPMLFDEIDATIFHEQMDTLASTFNVLRLSDAVQRLADGSLPPRSACITFDDGYANNAEIALPILQEHSLPACFFIATDFLDGECMWNDIVIEALRNTTVHQLDLSDVELGTYSIGKLEQRVATMLNLLPKLKRLELDARTDTVNRIVAELAVDKPPRMMMTPAQVRSLVDAGMEIGGHTASHPILATVTDERARAEISSGKEMLEEITGRPVNFFAYPNGRPGQDFDDRHISMIRKLGFEAAVTTASGVATNATDPFLLPRFTPWDRTPSRFVLRLYQNAMRRSTG